MSFIRPGQARKKKAFVRKKPTWDNSVSDLDSYRATPEEIKMRKEAHKSKNHISVKLEKMRKEKQRQRAGLTNVEARHVAIMKEVLHDQQQFDTVLSKTDQMMAMVKDLFGDDAKKFTGFPNVTLPPGNQRSSSNLVPSAPEIRTRIEALSESVMSQSAINDLSETESSGSEAEDQQPEPISFQSQIDIQRFQQFLQEEESRNLNNSAIPSAAAMSQADLQRLRQLQQFLQPQELTGDSAGGGEGRGRGGGPSHENNQTLSTISGRGGASIQFSQQAHGPAHSTHLLADHPSSGQVGRIPPYHTPPGMSREGDFGHQTPPKSALNDTGKVKKSKRRVPQPESSQSTSSSLNMADMRKVLESLEAEIADFERKTGRRPATDMQRTETFTGYTVSLVTAVTKLTHYLKETEMRLQAEMMVREQLTQDVRQLALTIDSLTQEVIMTQEEYGKLFSEHQRYRQQMQGELALLQAQVLDVKHHQSSQGGSQHSTPGKGAAGNENADENFSALPEHVTPPSAAVLLSPVVRKTRVHDGPQPETLKKRQTSLVDLTSLAEDSSIQQEQQQTSNIPVTTTATASSSTLASTRTDPPRLTQAPPVMATVTVPRPISLVQSNVGVSLPGSQAAGPVTQSQSARSAQTNATLSSAASGYTQRSYAVSSSTAGLPGAKTMETQIAELNRQHAEAQQRLQSLLAQQKRQHNQLQALHDDGGERGDMVRISERHVMEDSSPQNAQKHPVQEGAVPNTVSPPISPISQRSEHFGNLNPVQRLASMSREIKVALPTVDLEVSAGSIGTPP